MLKDITIGQYYPADSLIHKLDPSLSEHLSISYLCLFFTHGATSLEQSSCLQ